MGDRGLDLKEMESLLQPGRNPDIDKIYNNFNVQDVQVNVKSKYQLKSNPKTNLFFA